MLTSRPAMLTVSPRDAYPIRTGSPDRVLSSILLVPHPWWRSIKPVKALRLRESNAAIVGAVNCLFSPELSIAFCQARMLSPAGRCKTFDAHADGFVRAEGCGAVVLKRLSDAQAMRDPYWL